MKYGIGIDISKEKSTAAIIDEEKNLLLKVFEIMHNQEDMEKLEEIIKKLGKENVRIVMEATGRYHFPVYNYLLKRNYFVVAENAYLIKKYIDKGIRKAKTDKKDARKIAEYVIDNWKELKLADKTEKIYEKLRFLSREYSSQISIQVKQKVDFSNLCDLIFPGYYGLLNAENFELGLKVFKKYYDVDKIKSMTEKEFIEKVSKLGEKAKQKGASITLAKKAYLQAYNVISPLPIDNSMNIVINKSIDNLLETINTTNLIITEMEKIAIGAVPEYEIIKSMEGVGKKLSLILIAEIGDIRRFKNAGSLIAYAGIDAPPYQSGKYELASRKISKRGNKYLRKALYEVSSSVKRNRLEGKPIYEYIIKKENEGKPKKVAKIAGANKFLKIYYGCVKKLYE